MKARYFLLFSVLLTVIFWIGIALPDRLATKEVAGPSVPLFLVITGGLLLAFYHKGKKYATLNDIIPKMTPGGHGEIVGKCELDLNTLEYPFLVRMEGTDNHFARLLPKHLKRLNGRSYSLINELFRQLKVGDKVYYQPTAPAYVEKVENKAPEQLGTAAP